MATPGSATINVTIPISEKKAIEIFWVARALELAAEQIRGAEGTVVSGTMTDGFGVPLGTWSYTPQS